MQVFFCQEAVGASVGAAEGLVPRAPDLGVRRAVGGGLLAVGAAVVTLAPHAGQGQRGAGGRRVLAEVRRGHGVTRARGGRGHGSLATLGIVTGGRRGHGGGSGCGGGQRGVEVGGRGGHLGAGHHDGEQRHQRAQQLAEEHERDQPQGRGPQLTQPAQPHPASCQGNMASNLCPVRLSFLFISGNSRKKSYTNQAWPASFCCDHILLMCSGSENP